MAHLSYRVLPVVHIAFWRYVCGIHCPMEASMWYTLLYGKLSVTDIVHGRDTCGKHCPIQVYLWFRLSYGGLLGVHIAIWSHVVHIAIWISARRLHFHVETLLCSILPN